MARLQRSAAPIAPDWLRLYAGMGVRMLLVGNDLSLLVGALRERASLADNLLTDSKD